jgi:hypothetical protein
MKTACTVTKSTPTGDELISIWEDETSAVKEAKSLIPTLKGREEIQVDHWVIGERVCCHVKAYDDTYVLSDDDEDEDTPTCPRSDTRQLDRPAPHCFPNTKSVYQPYYLLSEEPITDMDRLRSG